MQIYFTAVASVPRRRNSTERMLNSTNSYTLHIKVGSIIQPNYMLHALTEKYSDPFEDTDSQPDNLHWARKKTLISYIYSYYRCINRNGHATATINDPNLNKNLLPRPSQVSTNLSISRVQSAHPPMPDSYPLYIYTHHPGHPPRKSPLSLLSCPPHSSTSSP